MRPPATRPQFDSYAVGLLTQRGARTSHAPVVARRSSAGPPAGASNARNAQPSGQAPQIGNGTAAAPLRTALLANPSVRASARYGSALEGCWKDVAKKPIFIATKGYRHCRKRSTSL
ncbi:MAG: hypothetical protein HGA21_09530 [Burkholderiaceae bacterium]|nr:hypothetical protein [Burkholderiaceae bacterium]